MTIWGMQRHKTVSYLTYVAYPKPEPTQQKPTQQKPAKCLHPFSGTRGSIGLDLALQDFPFFWGLR